MSDTCLFTGETLSPTTREEHTIPESLGGRVKSRCVTCDDFNNKCGSYLDHVLKLIYEPLLQRIAPLLPAASRPGRMPVDVPGEPKGLALVDGRVTRPGVAILEKDEKGHPKAAVGDDEKSLRRLARSSGKRPEDMKLSSVRATDATTYFSKVPIVCREAEVTVLKSGLLTFDHLLKGSPHRFTRDAALAPVRDFIRDAVSARRVDADTLHAISLGLQYEKVGLYRRLRNQLAFPQTPFEHLLLVATNQPGQCLELVWVVFGFDPFGFRLAVPWRGEQFAFGVVNSIVKGGGVSCPQPLALGDDLLCAPTGRCSIPHRVSSEAQMRGVLELISQERRDAYGKAVELVETTCDANLIECLVEEAGLSGPADRSVRAQVRSRLVRMYGRMKDDQGFQAEVDATLERYAGSVAPDMLEADVTGLGGATGSAWPEVLGLYRACLKELGERFGLPGDNFTNSVGLIMDPSDERLLGELPKMT
jgi:hypothetical protein